MTIWDDNEDPVISAERREAKAKIERLTQNNERLTKTLDWCGAKRDEHCAEIARLRAEVSQLEYRLQMQVERTNRFKMERDDWAKRAVKVTEENDKLYDQIHKLWMERKPDGKSLSQKDIAAILKSVERKKNG